MTKLFPLILIVLTCCSKEQKSNKPFPVLEINDDEWATYEGRWLAKDGLFSLELSLKSGAFGIDSYFELSQRFLSDSSASGGRTRGLYSTNYSFPNNELGICLHDLHPWENDRTFLRYQKISGLNVTEEMFFMTRGNEELIPCDDHYKPLTTDWKYTLHKRSKLFTVEGYITFSQDTAEFFERNVRERWRVAELGEFEVLRSKYKELAKEKYEGIYLKALAYSVETDTSVNVKRHLVIKYIKDLNNDPD